jgi:GntR family transcriptional regulator, transcriptional repressor for pyruvate dehydrogenase complex
VNTARNDRGAFRPLPLPRSLSHQIAERIAREIAGGDLAPGTRLPTEAEMVASMGVSRTVVREAVAALRADGLVVTRQGAGAFVAGDLERRPFRLALDGLPSVAAVLDVMELRASVEVEAAGLAATRGAASARRRVARALAAIDAALKRGESAIDEDFAFHRAIAEATGNAQFPHFLEYLGRFIIPRQSIRVSAHLPEGQRAYLETFQREHAAICDAIQRQDAAAARHTMRAHLVKSQERYRRLVAEAGSAGAAVEAVPGQDTARGARRGRARGTPLSPPSRSRSG